MPCDDKEDLKGRLHFGRFQQQVRNTGPIAVSNAIDAITVPELARSVPVREDLHVHLSEAPSVLFPIML